MTNDNEQLKIELLSQWKLEAESRNSCYSGNFDESCECGHSFETCYSDDSGESSDSSASCYVGESGDLINKSDSGDSDESGG